MRTIVMMALFAAVSAGVVGCRESNGVAGGDILRDATRVEVFRVGPDEVVPPGANTIGGYPILATAPEQGPEFAARLSAVLRGKGVTPNINKCGLRPGVAYRVWNGPDAVEVLVCFECDVLWPHVVGSQVEKPHFEWRDFGPVRFEMVRLAKQALPEDAAIQKLAERK